MVDHLMDTSCTNDGGPFTAPGSVPPERFSPVTFLSHPQYAEMSLAVLVAHCMRELNTYRRGETCIESYSVELIRRAFEGDQEARIWVQNCFAGVVLDWFHRHPQRAAACRLKGEEHYVAQTFEHFWRAIATNQRVECNTLAAVLHALRVSLHGVILDTLRAYAQPWGTSFPEEQTEPRVEDETSSGEVWEILQALLAERQKQRLAYLLFHCGLKPREIIRYYPHQWSDVHEIDRLRHTMLQRFLSNADHLLRVVNHRLER
jgi:hypothetical protein